MTQKNNQIHRIFLRNSILEKCHSVTAVSREMHTYLKYTSSIYICSSKKYTIPINNQCDKTSEPSLFSYVAHSVRIYNVRKSCI